MRRFLSLLSSDIRFQLRYGFYGVYAILTLAYAAAVRLAPPAWRSAVRALTVYSDPAALGFFFIGAIVLFEKGERVVSALAVSPASAAEYALSKLLSLGLISLASASVITVAGGGVLSFSFAAGAFVGSCLFTALGLAVAATAPSVNAFFVRSVPLGAFVFALGPLTRFSLLPEWLSWNPGSLILFLLEPQSPARPLALPVLLAWFVPACIVAIRRADRLFAAEALDDRQGGIA